MSCRSVFANKFIRGRRFPRPANINQSVSLYAAISYHLQKYFDIICLCSRRNRGMDDWESLWTTGQSCSLKISWLFNLSHFLDDGWRLTRTIGIGILRFVAATDVQCTAITDLDGEGDCVQDHTDNCQRAGSVTEPFGGHKRLNIESKCNTNYTDADDHLKFVVEKRELQQLATAGAGSVLTAARAGRLVCFLVANFA